MRAFQMYVNSLKMESFAGALITTKQSTDEAKERR